MKQFYVSFLFIFGWIILSNELNAQGIVKGKVTDESGNPLVGVTIYERGTTNGTVSRWDGTYSLNVSRMDATLVFSYTGYATLEVPAEGRSELNVQMREGLVLEGVVIVGSRALNRSVTNSLVPIDVLDVRQLTISQGQLDVNQILHYAAPSFNANRQTGADGSDHVDPATLRGLGPDQTLVLINGKRRHQSSLVNIYGTRGRGNTGTDLNAIPAAAIERIEILRDGASAQYGSDAIAGVINIVLKENVNEFTGNVNVGAHIAKDNPDRSVFDGENLQVNGNYGFRIGEGGFANFTVDYWSRGHTNRYHPSLYRRKFGDARGTNFSTYFNAAVPLSKEISLYAFGGSNFRHTNAYAWSRHPGTERNVDAIYPNGFDPIIATNITDRSLSVGVRGILHHWNTDLNHTTGVNRFHYYGRGTLNASLEERSPTAFNDGGFQLRQNTTNLTFSRFFREWLEGTNLAFGAEHRLENYQIFAGEEASWRTYGPVYFITPEGDSIPRPGGAQGFPGFSPQNEVDESRTNIAAFVDGEFAFSSAFTLGAAARFEHYSDFGNTLNGKLAARYVLTGGLALRGSISTGFRAPSLAQLYFNSIYTDFVSGVPIDKLLAKNNSPITRALGIEPLKEETSLNLGAGLTYSRQGLTLSADFYRIQIKDRIVLTADFSSEDDQIGPILRSLNVGSARFFANAINTTTTGLDLVAAYSGMLGEAYRFTLTLAGNWNRMNIDQVNTSPKLIGKEDSYLSRREKLFILASAPPMKGNLTFDLDGRQLGVNIRANYFGQIELEDFLGTPDIYRPRVTLDASIAYRLSPRVRWTVGGVNVLNAYPSYQDQETESGGLYDAVQMGFNGAFFFSRLNFRF
ncbi:MAG: TonB-dependent receptor [Saprospiraceae bacterium]|nr:TonB-dependent receptor [Saprospiraceae bacterium]MDW8483927.1 TonB-dependent receptor [Saprospiraceae bacterium]